MARQVVIAFLLASCLLATTASAQLKYRNKHRNPADRITLLQANEREG